MNSVINRFNGMNSSSDILPSCVPESNYDAHSDKTFQKAVTTTLFTVGSAILFGIGTYYFKGEEAGLQFFTGYLVEQSLSVDNLFVFLMLFNYFKVPLIYQDRVLTWGIIGAVVMRGIMIVVGIEAVERFQFITLVFAGILMVSAYKLLQEDSEEEDLSNNIVLKISNYWIKSSTEYDGDRFFTNLNGLKVATPLFMCLVCIELSDLVFAIDSIPAVLGISHDSFIVYTSNIFAILGLRSLYTILAKAVSDLPYLKPAVALVLGFVGGKMIGEYFNKKVSIGISLMVVIFLIGGGILLSFISKRLKKGIDIFSGNKRDEHAV